MQGESALSQTPLLLPRWDLLHTHTLQATQYNALDVSSHIRIVTELSPSADRKVFMGKKNGLVFISEVTFLREKRKLAWSEW